MHYEKVDSLLQQTKECVEKGGHFHYNLNQGGILELQNAVIRTNCIDCLDRTEYEIG